MCGLLLQPNTEETKFIKQAPYLDRLDACTVHHWYALLMAISHNYSIYIPPYEQHGPTRSFVELLCDDTADSNLPPWFRSDVSQWSQITHNHLNKDKVVPSNHPCYDEISCNPNGHHALQILLSPHQPACTDNHVLIAAHPQQGQ